MKLYEISENYRAFILAIESGEIPEEAICDTLDSIEEVFDQKADNIACLIKELRLDAQGIKEEADHLYARYKKKQSRAERLAKYLQSNMHAIGKKTIETTRNKISIKKNTASCRIVDEDVLIGYLQMHQMMDCLKREITIRKHELLMRLKDGEEIPGAELEIGERIEIK